MSVHTEEMKESKMIEKPNRQPRLKRAKTAVGVTVLTGLAGSFVVLPIYSSIETSRNKQAFFDAQLNEERNNTATEKATAIELGRLGIRSVADVSHKNGVELVTLSSNPLDPEACAISFGVSGTSAQHNLQLKLSQTDASGTEYSSVTITNAAAADKIVKDLCS